jgi:predicted nucleotidyltransferase
MTAKLEVLSARIRPLLHAKGVTRAAVFGSMARGEEHSESDLDLLVEFPKAATLLDLVALERELNDLLGVKVDVVTYNGLHREFRDEVLREQVLIL